MCIPATMGTRRHSTQSATQTALVSRFLRWEEKPLHLSSPTFVVLNTTTMITFAGQFKRGALQPWQRLLPQLPRGNQLPRHLARGKVVSFFPWRSSAPLKHWLNPLGGLKSELLGASEKVQTSESCNLNRGVNFLGDSETLFLFLSSDRIVIFCCCDLLGLSAKLWARMSSGSLSSDEQLSASTCLRTFVISKMEDSESLWQKDNS